MFSPLAWLKLMFFLHAGDTEIGGFAISSQDNPLYIEKFVIVQQTVSCVTVEFDDEAVADFFDECVDAGLKPERFARIWCHTHPGESPQPSMTDEETFQRVFGTCDWSIMFIIGRTGQTYARLSFTAGPGSSVLLPVVVDWSAWSRQATVTSLDQLIVEWAEEYEANVHTVPTANRLEFTSVDTISFQDANDDPWEAFTEYDRRQMMMESEMLRSESEVFS